jgi:iron-sulfur cluster repair protein YtfE (RIC family)
MTGVKKMANKNDLIRQHNEMREMIDFLKNNLQESKVRAEASQLAQNISFLAGKLRIHLIAEDDSLYPRLLEGNDVKAKEIAERFSQEMGNLSQVFTAYKVKYNISSRILTNVDAYINDTKVIVDALENRISREDKELYVLL